MTIVAGVIAVVVRSSTADLVDEIQLALARLAAADDEGDEDDGTAGVDETWSESGDERLDGNLDTPTARPWTTPSTGDLTCRAWGTARVADRHGDSAVQLRHDGFG